MHKYSLQPTTKLKTPLQTLFGKCSERKKLFQWFENSQKKSLQNCPFSIYVIGLQSRISDVSKKQTPRTMFPLSVLKFSQV